MTMEALPDVALAQATQSVRDDLETGLVPAAVFGNEDIHKAELRNVFAKSWLFLALRSEIPQPGDYVLRRMGEDEVIVSHSESGAIEVLLNKCRHRGTIVCRDDKGNTSHFRCPYHGWTYANDGSWAGAPKRSRAYRTLDPDQWGLLRAPRVTERWGLIFACLDEEAPSFEDYAGDALWYLDCFLGLDSRGLVALGEPNRWVARTNWKSGSENIGGDNYHVPTAHASCTEVGVLPDLREANEENAQFETGNGHVFTANRTFFAAYGLAPFGHTAEVWDSLDKAHIDERHLELHEKYFVFTGTFFPNFSVFKAPGTPDPVTGYVPIYTMLRLWQPAGPHKTEVWNWICAYKAEPEENRDAIYAAGMLTLGPAGMLEQDDMAVWEGTTAAGASVMAERLGMKFNYQLGLDGMSAGGPLADFPGPGTAVDKSYNEGNQRAFMRQWERMMREVQ